MSTLPVEEKDGETRRRGDLKERSTTRRIRTRRSNWSDLPRDILQLIIQRLSWIDRIHIRAVCKGWSLINLDVHGLLPWAMELPSVGRNGQLKSWLFDPLSHEWVVRGKVVPRDSLCLTKEYLFSYEHRQSTLLASVYGWVLFHQSIRDRTSLFFLYSPFTGEIIRLPPCSLRFRFKATFSLNATSPRCVIFQFWESRDYDHKDDYRIRVSLSSPGDSSWKTFKFRNPYHVADAVDATYSNGVFYCVFGGGELGAFSIKDEDWNILVTQQWTWEERYRYHSHSAKLVISDNGDLRLLLMGRGRFSYLFKFVSSEMRWVEENKLDNHVLFIGITSFCIPTVGETSQLANTIFSILPRRSPYDDRPRVRAYGCGSCGWSPLSVNCVGSTKCKMGWIYPPWGNIDLIYCSPSPLCYNCVDATAFGICWIQLPSGGLWRASDLIRAV